MYGVYSDPMMEGEFTIGTLAKQSGVGVETVRFYERKGIIRQPTKNGGFRKYSAEDAKRIRFVRRAQELGFTLREIKELFKLDMSGKATCSDIQNRTEAKLKEVVEKILDLKKMKSSLEKLSKACGNPTLTNGSCRVLDCFEADCKC
jgi:MerR family transcriptional regulator, mercuric resistance operon regulatory protein